MPLATMADAAREYHHQGLPCPYDCAACDLGAAFYDPADFEEDPQVYLVQGPVGTVSCLTLAEAAFHARTLAKVSGRAVKVVKV
jgi:hypothetical protein